nr:hypothetical protein [Microlunatus parietis]
MTELHRPALPSKIINLIGQPSNERSDRDQLVHPRLPGCPARRDGPRPAILVGPLKLRRIAARNLQRMESTQHLPGRSGDAVGSHDL